MKLKAANPFRNEQGALGIAPAAGSSVSRANKPWKGVIVCGGFGGLFADKRLESDSVDVTLIDRRNYHLFQPLLYQVATGSLSAGEGASPPPRGLSRHKKTSVWVGTR